MKIILLIFSVILATSLTGGGIGALDGIDCQDIKKDDFALVLITEDNTGIPRNIVLYIYKYNMAGTETERSPNIIVPDNRSDCGGKGQWEMVGHPERLPEELEDFIYR